MTCLVVGASGFVGRALVPALADAGEQVRATSRRPPDRAAAGAGGRPGVTWMRCDVGDRDSVRAALQGVAWAYYLVHAMRGGERDFRRAERQGARNFVRAAEESGCKRIVYLGGVEPRGRPSEHLASRLEVGSILRSGKVPTIELRAAMIIGNGSISWQIVRDLAARLPIMILPRWLESRSRPIAIEDVVAALLEARRMPLERSEWFDVPGPEELSCREMLSAVGRLRGRRIPMVPIPLLTPRVSALWLRFVTGAPYEVARELVLGLEDDLLPRDERFFEAAGCRPRVRFEDAARAALESEGAERGLGGKVARLEERVVQRLRPPGRDAVNGPGRLRARRAPGKPSAGGGWHS
jgi:uncharacterized protein YbjT (DUF2867 family)